MVFSFGKAFLKRASTDRPPTPESKNPIAEFLSIYFLPLRYSIMPSAIAFAVFCFRFSVISSFLSVSFDKKPISQRTAGTVTNTGTQRNAGTETGSVSNNENGTDDYTNTHKARLFGNIGVTTSQQMLQSEFDIARWNMYEHIADLFASEFCIMVY